MLPQPTRLVALPPKVLLSTSPILLPQLPTTAPCVAEVHCS